MASSSLPLYVLLAIRLPTSLAIVTLVLLAVAAPVAVATLVVYIVAGLCEICGRTKSNNI